MQISFVTSNPSKVKHAQLSLAPFGIDVEQLDIDLIESRAENQEDIALEKARQAFLAFGKPLIVEDSGFFIDALNGFPKTHIKFSLKTLGIENVLKMLEGVENRRCSWRMTLAYVSGEHDFKTFTFVEPGEIALSVRPVAREILMSNYWRIYIPKVIADNSLALSEMPEKDFQATLDYFAKNNHFQQLGQWLAKHSSEKIF